MPEFTGDESPADIVRVVLEDFSRRQESTPLGAHATIIYQDGLPFLILQAIVKDDLGEFACQYRLDKMLINLFPECERLFDEANAAGLFGEVAEQERKKTVRHLAYYAMHMMLTRLILLQLVLFDENFNETMVLTAGTLFSTFAQSYQQAGSETAGRVASKSTQEMIDRAVDSVAKRRRELLLTLINNLPAMYIPMGRGRPPGSTKPAEQKAREAAEFEQEIEKVIRRLISPDGAMPTKTAVAKALGIGGLNPRTGTDSSLTAFRNKLDRLNVDYDAIVERVRLNK
ncbi:MAG TPA: hypothetical protein VG148_18490 [Pyrinomonadaceae bacterium]|nr:hypothetical protein [Pyrinomonadaceae bacterium]